MAKDYKTGEKCLDLRKGPSNIGSMSNVPKGGGKDSKGTLAPVRQFGSHQTGPHKGKGK